MQKSPAEVFADVRRAAQNDTALQAVMKEIEADTTRYSQPKCEKKAEAVEGPPPRHSVKLSCGVCGRLFDDYAESVAHEVFRFLSPAASTLISNVQEAKLRLPEEELRLFPLCVSQV